MGMGGHVDETLIHKPCVDERTPWSEEEEAILRRYYCDATESLLLAMLPKRSWIAISNRARTLGLRREKHGDGGAGVPERPWQEWEKDLIRAYYDARIIRDELRKRLPHRRWDYIKAKANDMGLKWVKRQPWEPRLTWEVFPEGAIFPAKNTTVVSHSGEPLRPIRIVDYTHRVASFATQDEAASSRIHSLKASWEILTLRLNRITPGISPLRNISLNLVRPRPSISLASSGRKRSLSISCLRLSPKVVTISIHASGQISVFSTPKASAFFWHTASVVGYAHFSTALNRAGLTRAFIETPTIGSCIARRISLSRFFPCSISVTSSYIVISSFFSIVYCGMKSSFIPESLKGLFVSILVFSLGRIVSILFRPLDATECCNGPRVFSRFLGRKASSTAKPFDGELVDAIAKSAAPALRDCPQLHWKLPAGRNQRIVSKTIVDDHTVQRLISDIRNGLWGTSDPPFSCPRDAFGWMCQEASLTDNELPDMFADPSLVQMATAAQAVPQDVLECTYADTPDSGVHSTRT